MTWSYGKVASVAARRGWVVLLAALLAGVAGYAVVAAQPAVSTSRAVLVVPAAQEPDEGAPPPEGFLGHPTEAHRLAATYAALLPQDESVLQATADAAGVLREQVSEAVAVEYVENTALIEVFVEATDTQRSAAIAAAFASVATSDEPVTAAIAPGSLQTVSVEPPEQTPAPSPALAAVAAAVLGAALGLIVVVFWERSHPRVDTTADLSTLLRLPINASSALSGAGAASMLRRWLALAGDGGTVIGVDCGGGGASARHVLDDVVARAGLSAATVRWHGPGAHFDEGDSDRPNADTAWDALEVKLPDDQGYGQAHRLLLQVARSPSGADGAGSPIAAAGDMVVMVVRRGTPVANVIRDVEFLNSVSMVPEWAFVHE